MFWPTLLPCFSPHTIVCNNGRSVLYADISYTTRSITHASTHRVCLYKSMWLLCVLRDLLSTLTLQVCVFSFLIYVYLLTLYSYSTVHTWNKKVICRAISGLPIETTHWWQRCSRSNLRAKYIAHWILSLNTAISLPAKLFCIFKRVRCS